MVSVGFVVLVALVAGCVGGLFRETPRAAATKQPRLKTPTTAPTGEVTFVPGEGDGKPGGVEGTDAPYIPPGNSGTGGTPGAVFLPYSCTATDGSKPVLIGEIVGEKGSMRKVSFRTSCWGITPGFYEMQDWRGEVKRVRDDARSVDLNPEIEAGFVGIASIQGEEFFAVYRDSGTDKAWERGRSGLFRLTGKNETSLSFEFVKHVQGRHGPLSTTNIVEISQWNFLYYEIRQTLPGTPTAHIDDIATVSFSTGANNTPTYWSGYEPSLLGEQAEIRWGADKIDLSCLPLEGWRGGDWSRISNKLAVGREIALFVKSDMAFSDILSKNECSPYTSACSTKYTFGNFMEAKEAIWFLSKDRQWHRTLLFGKPSMEIPRNGADMRPMWSEKAGGFFVHSFVKNLYFLTEDEVKAAATGSVPACRKN